MCRLEEEEREVATERRAFRGRIAMLGRPSAWCADLYEESAGVSKSLSIPDGYALGNSGDSGQNTIEALSNDSVRCLDSESIVR